MQVPSNKFTLTDYENNAIAQLDLLYTMYKYNGCDPAEASKKVVSLLFKYTDRLTPWLNQFCEAILVKDDLPLEKRLTLLQPIIEAIKDNDQ